MDGLFYSLMEKETEIIRNSNNPRIIHEYFMSYSKYIGTRSF